MIDYKAQISNVIVINMLYVIGFSTYKLVNLGAMHFFITSYMKHAKLAVYPLEKLL